MLFAQQRPRLVSSEVQAELQQPHDRAARAEA
jgi:hypothetical protein